MNPFRGIPENRQDWLTRQVSRLYLAAYVGDTETHRRLVTEIGSRLGAPGIAAAGILLSMLAVRTIGSTLPDSTSRDVANVLNLLAAVVGGESELAYRLADEQSPESVWPLTEVVALIGLGAAMTRGVARDRQSEDQATMPPLT